MLIESSRCLKQGITWEKDQGTLPKSLHHQRCECPLENEMAAKILFIFCINWCNNSRVLHLVAYACSEFGMLLDLNKCFNFRLPLEVRVAESFQQQCWGGFGGWQTFSEMPWFLPIQHLGCCDTPVFYKFKVLLARLL